jgi:hypothetical protein
VIKDKTGEQVVKYDESHALLIGVGEYTGGWPSLPGVKEDLQSVKQALERNGFNVVVVEDPDLPTLETAYRNFILTYGLKRESRLLFYFAGHGYTYKPSYATEDPKEWEGYIVSKEAPLPTERNLAEFLQHAMSLQRFGELARGIQSTHALFLFDSCFSGAIFALSRAIPQGITRDTGRPVRQFISSGSADQEVPDKSEFRRHFIAALEGEADANKDGYVTGSELGQFLHEQVAKYSNGVQTPQYGKIRHPFLDKGDFVFSLQVAALPSASGSFPRTMESIPPPPLVLRGHLQVNVNVDAARVIVDGNYIGMARRDEPLHIRDLDAGSVRVRIEAAGHEPIERIAKVAVNEWTQEAFILQSVLAPPPVSSEVIALQAPEQAVPPGAAVDPLRAPQTEEGKRSTETVRKREEDEERIREKERYTKLAEEAEQRKEWAEAKVLYEKALDIDPHDEAVIVALGEVKGAWWREMGTPSLAPPQLVMFTPHRDQFTLYSHQSRFFAVQVQAPDTEESFLHYIWRVDGQPVAGQEVFVFKDQPLGTHKVSVTVRTPSGMHLNQSWIVEVQKEEEGEKDQHPRWAPLLEVFDVKDPVVTLAQKQLTLIGKVRNIDERSAENIVIWISGLDEQGQSISRSIALPSPQPLAPGQIANFQVRMANHPSLSRFHIEVLSK